MSDDGGGDDHFVEETSSSKSDDSDEQEQGYGNKLKSSIAGLVIGPIVMLGACVFLFWNEGRNVNRIRALEESLQLVQLVNATASSGINYNLEGDLVHVAGAATSNENLHDGDFGITLNALKLSRSVETYQWTQQRSKSSSKSNGKTTTKISYSYEKEWKSGLENSNDFKRSSDHENPSQALLGDADLTADPIMLGNYELESIVTDRMNWYQVLSNITVENIPNGSVAEDAFVSGEYFYIAYNSSGTPSSPEVGDTRVKLEQVPSPTEVSVLGMQSGNQLTSYLTSKGGNVFLMERGVVSAAIMIQNATTANTFWTWGFRAGGMVIMFIGFLTACSLLTTLLDILPGPLSFLDDVVEAGVACIGVIVSLLCSSTIIAIAWIVYRPLIGGCILAGVAAIIGVGVFIQHKRKKKVPPEDTIELPDSYDIKPATTSHQDDEQVPYATSLPPQEYSQPQYSPTPQYGQYGQAPQYGQTSPYNGEQQHEVPGSGQQTQQYGPPIAAPVVYGQPLPAYNNNYDMSLPPQQPISSYAVAQPIGTSMPPPFAPVVMYNARTLDLDDEGASKNRTG
jgi:hypothetical protein